ncbi:MAG: hypothetical protein RBU29_10010 [bacterium]|jgi:hypothetical protein|nr:hypothetical protein [bacterium]
MPNYQTTMDREWKILYLIFISAFVILVTVAIGGMGSIAYVLYHGNQIRTEVMSSYQTMMDDYYYLNRTHPFTPPSEAILQNKRFEDFLHVRSAVAHALEEISQKLREEGEGMERRIREPGAWTTIQNFFSIRDMIDSIIKSGPTLGGAHVQALREVQMSPREYQWITQIMLGTLSKAEANGHPEATQFWAAYVDQFSNCCKLHDKMRFDMGRQRFRGRDMNLRQLTEPVEEIVYRTDNADLILQYKDRLLLESEAPTTDFIALYLDSILRELNPRRNRS